MTNIQNTTNDIANNPITQLYHKLSEQNQKIHQIMDAIKIDPSLINHADQNGKTALMLVCQYKMYKKYVKLLVENGADLNQIDDYGQSALMYALKDKKPDLETIKYLLDNGADESIKDHSGTSVWIMIFNKPNHEPLLDIFINHTKNDCDFYAKLSPLTLAIAKNESAEKIKELIDNGHDMNKPDPHTCIPFLYACQEHTDPKVIDMLIANGADMQAVNTFGCNALHLACAFNSNTKVIQTLIDHGMSLSDTDDLGYNALHHACSYNKYPHIIEFLLPKMQMDFPTSKVYERHPIKFALQNNPNIAVIHTLFQHFQIDINTTEEGGHSFFMLASKLTDEPKVLDYLIKHGANPWATTNNGGNALHLACYHNTDLDVIKHLVELGFDVNRTDINGQNTFHHAATNNSNLDVLKYLIEQKVDLYANDYGFNNAMHLACSFNQEVAVIEFLRSLNFDIHEACSNGSTMLIYACDNGNSLAVVKYLVNAGVDLQVINHDGYSVMDCLDQYNHHDVWQFIQGLSGKKSKKVLYS